LRGQVVSIAIAGAEKVLEREIDANAHKDVLDKFVAQL
jgi:F-type H+-transporting ATPase subunit b